LQTTPALPWLAAAGLAAAFCGLALLNSAGYQYGAGDQAFYIPVIRHAQQPGLFPRDAGLLEAQDRFTLFDESLAAASTLTGLSLPSIFLALHFAGLAAMAAAAMAIGSRLYNSPWTTAAFVMVLTLRHRIPRTGVNTLEGYLHPRMLAFAIGMAAVATYLRGRPLASLLLVAGAAVLHPTTALWFGLWLTFALVAAGEHRRAPMIAVAAAALMAVWAVMLGPLHDRIARMDDIWIAALQSKDYIFPTQWPAGTWALNLLYVITIVVVLRRREALGLAGPRERSLAIGCLALAALFVAALPFIAMRIALAVQLQISRVFWMLDLLAIAYAVWAFGEWRTSQSTPGRVRPRLVFAALTCVALLRGGYVMFVEHAGQPVIERNLPDDEWADAMRWLQSTPVASHVLADSGHAWRYGRSVRVAAERDVLLEEVKDAAVALYSRDVALRFIERATAVGDSTALTTSRARELAATYQLDWLVTEQELDLPVAYRNARFRVYKLR
jgi:hypothetical protein